MFSDNLSNIYVIGAHPDDIEYSCFGLLSFFSHKKVKIHISFLSYGSSNDETSSDKRIQESKLALKSLNIKNISFRKEKGIFYRDYEEISENLRKEILLLKPELVLSHDLADTHQEHRLTHEITVTATRRLKLSFMTFRSPSYTNNFKFNLAFDITKYYGEKIKSLQFHKTQKNRPYMKKKSINDFNIDWSASIRDMKKVELFNLKYTYF